MKSDSNDNKYVANNKIQVFIEYADPSANDGIQVERWDNDPNEIFIQAYDSDKFTPFGSNPESVFSKLYNEDSKVYTAYMNENKTYEVKFGNNVLGKRLSAGDRVHIMYLESNGPDGYIDLSKVELTTNTHLLHSPSFFGLSQDLYNAMFSTASFNIEQDNIGANNLTCEVTLDPNSLT